MQELRLFNKTNWRTDDCLSAYGNSFEEFYLASPFVESLDINEKETHLEWERENPKMELRSWEIFSLPSEQDRFEELIGKRIAYLDGLNDLREDWISGSSKKPSKLSIEKLKAILKAFSKWVPNEKMPIPELVMGPIPVGGIGIEFIISPTRKILLSVFNDLEIEIETLNDDLFDTVDVSDEVFLFKTLTETYKSLV